LIENTAFFFVVRQKFKISRSAALRLAGRPNTGGAGGSD
jgi:hypothetical protein